MDIYQDAKIYNLDVIPEDGIITVTCDNIRHIFNRNQLIAKLCRRKKRSPPPSKATRVKADKA